MASIELTSFLGAYPQAMLRERLFREGGLLILLLYTFVALLPSVYPRPAFVSLYDSRRLLQLVLLSISAIWLLWTLRKRMGPIQTFYEFPTSVQWGMLFVLSIGFLSSFLAAYPKYALLEAFHLVLLTCLTFWVSHLYKSRIFTGDLTITMVITAAVILYLFSFMVGYTMSLLSPAITVWPEGFIGFAHIRFFNQYQSWTLPLLVLPPILYSSRTNVARCAWMIPAVMWWMLLIASGGRGTLLAILSATIFVLLAYGGKAVPWIKLQAYAAIIGMAAFGLLFKVISISDESILDRDITNSSERLKYWGHAIQTIQDHWLIGIGPMHHANFEGIGLGHPHNVVLQWGVEWGVPATVAMLIIVAGGFRAWVRQSRAVISQDVQGSQSAIRVALTASLVCAGTHALFSGVTVMPMSQTMMTLIVGWALGMYASCRNSTGVPSESATLKPLTGRTATARWRRAVVAAFILVAVLHVAAVSTPDAMRLQERENAYSHATSDPQWRPRFWRQGNIRY